MLPVFFSFSGSHIPVTKVSPGKEYDMDEYRVYLFASSSSFSSDQFYQYIKYQIVEEYPPVSEAKSKEI